MKIVFLSRYQNSVNRGVESFVKELTHNLSKNFSIEVLSGEESDSFSKMVRGRYNVVIPMMGRVQSLKASLGRLLGKYKVVVIGQSGIGKDEIWNIACTKPDVFVALTDHMYKWAKRWAWGTRVVKIPNGVDLDVFNPKGEKMNLDLPRPIILSVGALVWYKYHERVIEAVSKLDKGSLLIVGSGELESRLRELGEKKLGSKFKIIQTTHEEMPKIYRSADLFTLPSWDREAFGIVYIEALASNLAVVAPDDESRREIVGDGGILVDVTKLDEYVKALDDALKTEWGDRPRKQASKFSWQIIAQKYEKLFKELI